MIVVARAGIAKGHTYCIQVVDVATGFSEVLEASSLEKLPDSPDNLLALLSPLDACILRLDHLPQLFSGSWIIEYSQI